MAIDLRSTIGEKCEPKPILARGTGAPASNKVEIELRVVQFWTEIKLVITNRTPASRSCDFVITRLISVQIALHSVQLPLLIAYVYNVINYIYV